MNRSSPKVLMMLFALTLTASLAAAESSSYWQAGTGFQIGGVYFHVVSVAPNSEALFRVSQRLDAAGLEEHPDCYRVSSTFYHQESCPVVQEHFRRYADEAGSSAPAIAAVGASGSSGSHPINYLQGNYEAPEQAYWRTGFWFTPWFGAGYGSGYGHGFRPGRPLVRPALGFGRHPGVRPPRGGGFYRGGYAGGFSGH